MEKEIEKLQELLKSDPSNFQARRELSILLAKNGFNEEAKKMPYRQLSISNLNQKVNEFINEYDLSGWVRNTSENDTLQLLKENNELIKENIIIYLKLLFFL